MEEVKQLIKPCDKCGDISNHTVGDRRLCCKCYVGEGNPPADWHCGCMEAYRGVKYKCEGVCFAEEFWWYSNGFHYKVDKNDFIYNGMDPFLIPDWASVCNSQTEKYIKENCYRS